MLLIFFSEIRECFQSLNEDADCRSIVLSGAGVTFTAGLDLTDMSDFFDTMKGEGDLARKAKIFYKFVRDYQDSFTALEKVIYENTKRQEESIIFKKVHLKLIEIFYLLFTVSQANYCCNSWSMCWRRSRYGVLCRHKILYTRRFLPNKRS